MIPIVAKTFGASDPKTMKPGPAVFRSFSLPRGRHAHLEQEQAEHALEQGHEEVVVGARDLLSLQTADEADDDAAEEQVEARVEEDLVQQLAA